MDLIHHRGYHYGWGKASLTVSSSPVPFSPVKHDSCRGGFRQSGPLTRPGSKAQRGCRPREARPAGRRQQHQVLAAPEEVQGLQLLVRRDQDSRETGHRKQAARRPLRAEHAGLLCTYNTETRSPGLHGGFHFIVCNISKFARPSACSYIYVFTLCIMDKQSCWMPLWWWVWQVIRLTSSAMPAPESRSPPP